MLQQLFLVQLPQQILILRPKPSRHSPTLTGTPTQIIKRFTRLINASAALPGSVTSADFDLSPETISALTDTHRHTDSNYQTFYSFNKCFSSSSWFSYLSRF
jgi:hypothetical protein